MNPFQIEQILASVARGDKRAEEVLFKWLHKQHFTALAEAGLAQGEAKEVLLDAIIAFMQRVRKRKFKWPQNVEGKPLEQMVGISFRRVLDHIIYHEGRSVFRLVEGVKMGVPIAEERLGKYLGEPSFSRFAKRLMEQFDVKAMEADDFVRDAVVVLFEKIKSGNFSLEKTEGNTHNQNRLAKYFRMIVFNKISKWKVRRGKEVAAQPQIGHEFYGEDKYEMNDPETGLTPDLDALKWKMKNIIDQMGQPCSTLLRAVYFEHKKPKVIIAELNHPEIKNAEQVKQRKITCTRKLHKNFVNQMVNMDTENIITLNKIAMTVTENLKEPCRTILTNYLPPNQKSMAEIAEIVQRNLPHELVVKLNTPEQVKRRRFKCTVSLHDLLWKTIFQPEN